MHVIYQRHHIPPDEVYAKQPKVRALMYASDILESEAQEKSKNDK